MQTSDDLAARLARNLERPAYQRSLGVIAWAIAGSFSVFVLGRDTNWDLVNYHFYNPWALLHGRIGYDLAPAQMQSYLNPLLDLPFYAMVMAGWPSQSIAFLMALPAAIGATFLLKILLRLFAPAPPRQRLVLVALSALMGLTAAAPVSMLASTMNEWPGAMLFLIATWHLMPSQRHARGTLPLVAAGLLMGAACGLKLNLVPMAIGALAATVVADCFTRSAWRDAGVLGCAMAAGILVTSGWWMWKMQVTFGSPLYPFFNGVLRSPWFDPVNVPARFFGPHALADWPLFPLRFLRTTSMLVTEPPFRDWRWAMAYALTVIAVIAWTWRRVRRLPDVGGFEVVDRRAARFALTYVGASFAVWAMQFSVLRYLVAIEVLVGAVLVILLSSFVSRPSLVSSVACVTVLALANVNYPNWGHLAFDGPYVQGHVPPVPPGTLVLLTNAEPIAYIAPFFEQAVRFVGLDNNLNNPSRRNAMQDAIRQAIDEHRGAMVAIAYPVGSDMEPALEAYGLRLGREACVKITSNMATSPIAMCPVERAPPR